MFKSLESQGKSVSRKPRKKTAGSNQQAGALSKPAYCWFWKGSFKGRESTMRY